MERIAVFENVSLDGVTQDPTGEEGFNAADWRAGVCPGPAGTKGTSVY